MRPRGTLVGLRTAAVVLAATLFPVVSLLWASGVANIEVENRAFGGMAAIADATSLQEHQAWDDALQIVTSGAARPALLSALESPHRQVAREIASQSAESILMAGPFGDVRMYDPAGNLLADRLGARLRWVALTLGMLGASLATALGIFLSRRSRRLAASERQLAGSQVEARQRLEQFLDAMPIGVLVATPDGHPRYANREAQRLLGPGVVPGAAPGEPAEAYPTYVAGTSDLYPCAQMPLIRALNGETSHADDMEVHMPDATVPVEFWGTPVLAGDDSIEFGITAFADVSERHRAAEELQLLSAITANMSEGVMLVRTEDGTIAYGNSSLDAMFGYEAGELVGRVVRDLNAPGITTPEETAAAIIESLRSTGSWRGEVQNVRKDGVPFWCAVNVTTHHLPKFGPVWISVLSDITARRQAQEAQARLASIVQASREAILGKTLDGIVTSWNPGAQVLFGYTAAEMIGASIEVLIAPERRDEETALRGRVARGLGVEQYETVRLRKDGSSVDVSVTLSLIEDTEGRIAGIATICQDISERKRARAALLEREDQLAAARDQALEASRLKSQFLANMSHEIRTPMNGVLGMAQLLLTGNLEPGQRRRVLALRESGQSLLTIINDILDFSKMEAGKLELEQADFNLLAAAESVVSLLSSPANDKGLRLTLNVARGVPTWVRGDSGRLRQVLINLLSNAVKFTERGGVDFSVGQTASGDLRFAVRDTGIGIDPSSKDRLLEPFTQADASTTRRFGGTGLGLAICRQLVELMGGRLEFASQPGAGTTFWFEVALAAVTGDAVDAAGNRTAGNDAPDGTAPALGENARILLVDDAEINREVGRGLLESLGYKVEMASSGSEAVEAVRHSRYAAIVMDCLMPDMDGYEATRRIRALEGPGRHTPIVALTAAAMAGDRERCLAAGMDDYVSKPLDLDLLHAALGRCGRGLAPQPVSEFPEVRLVAGDELADGALLDRLELIGRKIPADAFARICRQFLSGTPELIAELGAAVRASDTDTAIALAHKLKGSMATLGAVRLSRLARRVEEGEKDGAAGLEAVLGEMDEAYGIAQAVVVSLMPQGPAG
jgi:PAS domain S-box-containing protein